MLLHSGADPEELARALTVYIYTPAPGEDFIGIAARCVLSQGTLATINRLGHAGDDLTGRTLLLPSMRGLFLPVDPGNDFERLLDASRERTGGAFLTLGEGSEAVGFYFLPGADLGATERLFFLNDGFRFPLKEYTLSDRYGPRVNPVTGKYGVHQGLDLAAPEGTAVYAARAGEVTAVGEDATYGKYVIISHEDGWTSLYGHLSRVETAKGRTVLTGSLIGRVGSTGQATGPHLHFELRQNGLARDPEKFLRLLHSGQ